MVDPVYQAGVSPSEDEAILNALPGGPPQHYANSQFVLDPDGTRRGTRADSAALHWRIESPFHTRGEFCMTCHEVGNIAVSRQADGTYRYNALNQRVPDENPHAQFPLERTGSEWKLSAFANGGVDMGGRFGGTRGPVVSTCQDCHMPGAADQACFFGPTRPDRAGHQFAGASAQVLDLIIEQQRRDNGEEGLAPLHAGRAAAVSMLQRAATLELAADSANLDVRVINESGHKLPTGHIEGRRVWVNVRFLDAHGRIVREHGRYDQAEALLDESTTTVYEMHLGLSLYASQVTGLPAGQTMRMSLADPLVKDNRIPPRGFDNAAFAAAGRRWSHQYDDGQYWDDLEFALPGRAIRAEVAVYYQQTPRGYVEHLRDHNHTDHWGDTSMTCGRPRRGANPDHQCIDPTRRLQRGLQRKRRAADAGHLRVPGLWFAGNAAADFDGNDLVQVADIFAFLTSWFGGCS